MLIFFTLVSSELPSPLAPKSNTSKTVELGAFSSSFFGGGISGNGGDGAFCLDFPAWFFPFLFEREEATRRFCLQCRAALLAPDISILGNHTSRTIKRMNVKFLTPISVAEECKAGVNRGGLYSRDVRFKR